MTSAQPRRKARAPAPGVARAAERRHVMNALQPIVRMLGTMVGNHIEVVLHDMTKPESSIVAIANGHVSGRRIGNPILSGPKGDQGFAAAKEQLAAGGEGVHSVIEGYATLSRSGRRLHSSTVVFRDAGGAPFAALCLNADHAVIEAAHTWLGTLLQQSNGSAAAPADEQPDLDALIRGIIADAVQRLGRPVALMGKDEKIAAVEAMMQRGLFMVKGGVERAASALGVTRFTIYNYLDALRANGAVPRATVRRAAERPARGRRGSS
jgi:predicted transcriptional regulator YheO